MCGKVSSEMFSVYYVCTRSDVTRANHKVYARATCSVYFSAHCDREYYKRTFVIFAGASVRPGKLRSRLKLA